MSQFALMCKNAKNSSLIIRVQNTLPGGFQSLLDASLEEGVRNMLTLLQDWKSGAEKFDQHGAALFAAIQQGVLAGVAGTTRELGYNVPAMRMRRLYVSPAFRRQGIAKKLAQACMDIGLLSAQTLTCNAGASAAAPPLWVSMGFNAIDRPNITHVYVAR